MKMISKNKHKNKSIYISFSSYQKIRREKMKPFNTNKEDLLNKKKRVDINLVDNEYYYIENLDGFQLDDEIKSAMKKCLSDREQTVIYSRFFYGMTINEIARNTYNTLHNKWGVSDGIVSNIVFRALRKLRHPNQSKRLREIYIGAN